MLAYKIALGCLNVGHITESDIQAETFMESAKVGKRGAIVVPAKLRKRFGIEEGSIVVAEETAPGEYLRSR